MRIAPKETLEVVALLAKCNIAQPAVDHPISNPSGTAGGCSMHSCAAAHLLGPMNALCNQTKGICYD